MTTKPPLSLADAAIHAGRFLARERTAVSAIAATFLMLPPLAVELLLPDFRMASPDMTRLDPRAIWIVPVMLAALFGGMALTAFRLRPGGSVADALGLAVRRLPAMLAVGLIVGAGATVLLFAVLVAASFVGLLAGVGLDALTRFGSLMAMLLILGVSAKLVPLVPVLMREGLGPVATLRRSWALTRGWFGRLAAGTVLLMLAVTLSAGLARTVLASVGRLLDLVTGVQGLFGAVAAVLVNLIGAGISAFACLAIAEVYRQLARP